MTAPDLSTMAAGLSEAQKRALLAMGERYKPAREIGTSGGALMAMSDLWRTQRGVQPPIQLTIWDVDDGSGGPLARVWALSSLGLAVRQYLREVGR